MDDVLQQVTRVRAVESRPSRCSGAG